MIFIVQHYMCGAEKGLFINDTLIKEEKRDNVLGKTENTNIPLFISRYVLNSGRT